MVYKIKFNNPLLDNYIPDIMTKSEHEQYMLSLIDKIDALYVYFSGGKDHIPQSLTMPVAESDYPTLWLIYQLAVLAKIPGFVTAPQHAGQPSKWDGESGFILSARIQVYLLKNPNASKHKAIIKCLQKSGFSQVPEGIYRRYLAEEKKESSIINLPINIVNKLKSLNTITDSNRQDFINTVKRQLNKQYKTLYSEKSKDIFTDVYEPKQVLHLNRIDLEQIFKDF